jgi:MFS family permease
MTAARLGPITLAPGILPRHVLAYLAGAFVSIGLFTFLTALTPYVLRVNLGLPDEGQGRLSGDLQFAQELAILVAVGYWGALSDRHGRRFVLVAGFLLLAAAYVLYGFARSVPELYAARLLFGIGTAAGGAMLTAVVAGDYPDERSRGALTGLTYVVQGLGATAFFFGLTRLPAMFAGNGASELWAGRLAYLTVAAIAVAGALAFLGMHPGRREARDARRPLLAGVREGLAAGRNPRIALAYASSFAARADLVMITLFLTLWVTQAASSAGMTPGAAAARAGIAVGISQLAALVWSGVFGVIADRLDRVTAMALAFALAALGYGAIALAGDPTAPAAIPLLVLLGIGQASAILAPALLLGQAAAAESRGAAFGLQALCGGAGILGISFAGGRLFDAVGPYAPFALMAVGNALVMAWALMLRRRNQASTTPA